MQHPERPYLVTEDLPHLVAAWTKERGFRMPVASVFARLRQRLIDDLGTLFTETADPILPDRVVFLEHDPLRGKIDAALASVGTEIPLVTLDRLYFPDIPRYVDVTRIVMKNETAWTTIPGVGVRVGEPSLDDQVERVVRKLPQGTRAIRLLDDGFWSGTTTQEVSHAFQRHGIAVVSIHVAILVETDDNRAVIQRNDPPLFCLAEHFPHDRGGVIDWVCQRDFFPGVPFGGRTVAYGPEEMVDVGAYYVDPTGDRQFGHPAGWASLDGGALGVFSHRRLEDSALLFSAVEAASDRPVLIRDLARVPYGMQEHPEARFVDVLLKHATLTQPQP